MTRACRAVLRAHHQLLSIDVAVRLCLARVLASELAAAWLAPQMPRQRPVSEAVARIIIIMIIFVCYCITITIKK